MERDYHQLQVQNFDLSPILSKLHFRFGKAREGLVVAKWKLDAEKVRREQQLKAAQLAAERREQELKKAETTTAPIDMKAMRKMLEEKLYSPITVKN
jgi:hypothetical protein